VQNPQPAQESQPVNIPQAASSVSPQGNLGANNPLLAQVQLVLAVSLAIIGTDVVSAISGGSKAPAIILPGGSTLQPNVGRHSSSE
jgi:hypothetical protein